MRCMLEVTYIGLITSWKWVLGSTVVVAALIGLLFGIGVLAAAAKTGARILLLWPYHPRPHRRLTPVPPRRQGLRLPPSQPWSR